MTTSFRTSTQRPTYPGSLLVAMRHDPVGFLSELAARHGDIAEIRFGPRRIVLLSHPELARELLVVRHRSVIKGRALRQARRILGDGLLTSEGDAHLQRRRLLQPIFHRERVATYATVMAAHTARAVDSWHPGATYDIAAEMMRLTLAIAGQTLFGADVEADAAAVGHALNDLMALFGLLIVPWGELLLRLPLPAGMRLRRAEANLDAIVARLIAERRNGRTHTDLLSLLLAARTADNDKLSDAELRDEVLTIFLAGHETTAVALTWALYLLAQHPVAEAQLHAEVDQVLAGRLPAAVDLANLPYTRAIFAEALRLYPPAWVIGRQLIEDAEIGGCRIAAGTNLLVSPWVMQRDPRFFAEPGHFRPERWSFGTGMRPEAAGSQGAYIPFGMGSRMCIGEGFAWMEGALVLATIAQRWCLRLRENHQVVLQPAVTLRPRGGLPMHVVPREGREEC